MVSPRPNHSQKILAFTVLALASDSLGTSLSGVPTDYGFTEQLSDFVPSLILPATASKTKISMPIKNILTRIKKSKQDDRVEPMQLFVKDSPSYLMRLAVNLAQKNKIEPLFQFFKSNIEEDISKLDMKRRHKITISTEVIPFVNIDALSEKFARYHYDIRISPNLWRNQPSLGDELLRQLHPYLEKKRIASLRQKMQKGESLRVDEDILPHFARKMVGKYTVYRGPNCFHSALAFQAPTFAKSKRINVKREEGHHDVMINYDELWRALQSQFYEINPKTAKLQYGDLIIFFQRPPNQSHHAYFRNIKHASAYLFGPYTFSKGSKSPNTPYTVKTLAEEWSTWGKIAENMGAKVFRKKLNRVRKKPLRELTDWLY